MREAAERGEKTLRTVEGILQGDKDNFRARHNLANVCHLLGLVYGNLGQRDGRHPLHARGRSPSAGQLVAEHPSLPYLQQNQGRSLNNLATLYHRFHENKQAVAAYELRPGSEGKGGRPQSGGARQPGRPGAHPDGPGQPG